MADNNHTQLAENQQKKSKRDAFMERFGQRFPDVQADDEDAFYGRLSDEFDRMDRSDAAQKELGELLVNDPRSAGFLMVMRKGGNPMEYLIEQYGDDFREALNDETKAKEFAAAFSKYAEKQAKNKALQEQAEQNMEKMLADLDVAKEEGKFTDEDADKAYTYLYGEGGLLDRLIINDITKDDWMMLMKAANYDAMQAGANARVAEARHEGEVAGRNANINTQKHRRTRTADLPSDLSQSGGGEAGRRSGDPLLERLDKIVSRSRSVWED